MSTGSVYAASRCCLRGVGFDAVTEGQVVESIIARAQRGVGGRVVTPNVDILRQALSSAELRELVVSADFVLADGMPIVWALRLAREPVPGRVAGSALGPLLVAAAEEARIGVFMLGGAPGTAERAVGVLQSRHPRARLGWYCPPFGFENDSSEKARIAAAVAEFGPGIYFCGLGFPKQDKLGAELLAESAGSWFIGAGATIAFLAGEFQRAPGWMQRTGLEWVHRLVLEPRRLWRRYLGHDMTFAIGLLVESSILGARRVVADRRKTASGV